MAPRPFRRWFAISYPDHGKTIRYEHEGRARSLNGRCLRCESRQQRQLVNATEITTGAFPQGELEQPFSQSPTLFPETDAAIKVASMSL